MNKTNFAKDEARARLTIERQFLAEPARIWRFLTEPALLDQWWAPAPWKTVTKQMDFRIGGRWLYSMNGPEGEEHFCRMDFLEIEHGIRMKSDDYFCDADGRLNESLPSQSFDTSLVAEGKGTKVVTVVQYASLDDMNTILEMGMREGLSQAYEQLETLLAA
jgi:uncharacterized protein YndB with AHSA1/START domain